MGIKKGLLGETSKPFVVCIAQLVGNGFLSSPEERVVMPPTIHVCVCCHNKMQI